MRNRLLRMWLVLLSVALLAACAVFSRAAEAQPQDSQSQQGQSVADAARRSREQKKNAARQARVISNEDLDTEYFIPGQEGLNLGVPAGLKREARSTGDVAAAEAASQTATSANKESRRKGKDSEEAAAEDAEIARLKGQIAEAEEHLKWQQRELSLDQDTVYSNPNYTDFKTGKAKLDAEQQQINQRQQEIEALKASLAVVQERRKQTGRPLGAQEPITMNLHRRQSLFHQEDASEASHARTSERAQAPVNTDTGAGRGLPISVEPDKTRG
jgi:hypothetical protein